MNSNGCYQRARQKRKPAFQEVQVSDVFRVKGRDVSDIQVPFGTAPFAASSHPKAEAKFLSISMFPGENNSPYHDLGSLEHLSPGGTKLTRLWVRTDSSFPELDGQDFAVVQSLSRVRFLVTPGTAALQASLSFTIYWSLLKLMSVKSMMPSNHLILCWLLLLPSIFPSIRGL